MMRFVQIALGLVMLGRAAAGGEAKPATGAAPPTPVLDEVLVTGERPGPGMWRVSSGDRELWILATFEPLPKNMTWHSQAVEARIAASQQVMAPPRVSTEVGFFRGLTLLPALLKARNSPDGQSLEQVLPHDLYIRWLALRVKYLDNSASDEQRRPMLAALDLYTHALKAAGLTLDETVWATVEKLAQQRRVAILPVTVEVKLVDPQASIRELAHIARDAEIGCLRTTIERLETDLQPMRQRANMWAVGDLTALRAQHYPDERIACLDAFFSVPGIRDAFENAKRQVSGTWMEAAERALARNDSTLAVLPLADLVGTDGFLDRLRAQGYAVQEPP